MDRGSHFQLHSFLTEAFAQGLLGEGIIGYYGLERALFEDYLELLRFAGMEEVSKMRNSSGLDVAMFKQTVSLPVGVGIEANSKCVLNLGRWESY